nr:helix-turn-helix domain-containing protein [Campylobacter hyointestinalis]
MLKHFSCARFVYNHFLNYRQNNTKLILPYNQSLQMALLPLITFF